MKRRAPAISLALCAVLVTAGCTSSKPISAPPPTALPALSPVRSATPAVTPTPGPHGCGSVYPAGATLPAWTGPAHPPTGLSWVMPTSANMVGILFGDPFQTAPRTDGKSNKILWISQAPRNGQTLEVTGQRLSDGMTATASQAADASPGEIYPAIIDMPAPGCWQLSLAWGPNKATVDLYYA